MRILAVIVAATPFAFGLIRLIHTRNDARYLIVAAASLAGGAVAMKVARVGKVAGAFVVFLSATVVAVLSAMLLGTRLGPGILIVAASFGFCFAAASAILSQEQR